MNQTQPKNQTRDIKTAVPGPGSRALRAREDAHVAPGLQGYAVMAGIVVDGGAGQRRHRRRRQPLPRLHRRHRRRTRSGTRTRRSCAAVQEQVATRLGRLVHLGGARRAGERLAAAPPAPGVHRLQLYSGGAEAVESALRLAKCHTGKYEFVSFWGGFHGKTMGALSLMGSTFKDKLGPMVPGAHHDPVCRLLPLPARASQYPSCGIACAEIARKQVKTASARARSPR